MRARSLVVLGLLVAVALPVHVGCSSSAAHGTDNGRGGGSPGGVAMSGQKGPGVDGSASGPASEDGGSLGDGSTSPGPDNKRVVTQVDAAVGANVGPLPPLTNVAATEREDSVGIDFDPIDNAVDYRVYPLPNPSDVTTNTDGSLTIKNAIYRCAGLRQSLDLPNNTSNNVNKPNAGQVYVNGMYSWGATVPAKPTLGYVYLTPASDRLPVYAVAVHPTAPENGWREARPKIYTTDSN
ncbi:MAG TPA: hypothetical protein VN894_18510, partial [Polyangiaceae bacterium]|nr:hypothetical protein [Polyangiaceae bacterium]